MASWKELRAEPPWPNQVTTKKRASAIMRMAKIWRQKPPGSSCPGEGSFSTLVVLREDLLLAEDFLVDLFLAAGIYIIYSIV